MAVRGAADALGQTARLYRPNEILKTDEPWQVNLAKVFISNGWAIEVADGYPAADFELKRKPGRPKRVT